MDVDEHYVLVGAGHPLHLKHLRTEAHLQHREEHSVDRQNDKMHELKRTQVGVAHRQLHRCLKEGEPHVKIDPAGIVDCAHHELSGAHENANDHQQ